MVLENGDKNTIYDGGGVETQIDELCKHVI